ncbi:hypothetical protein V6Z11_A01G140000 [Gossypium hirsutum]
MKGHYYNYKHHRQIVMTCLLLELQLLNLLRQVSCPCTMTPTENIPKIFCQ